MLIIVLIHRTFALLGSEVTHFLASLPDLLLKLSGFLSEIDGCLSTGKEANVYYAAAGPKASGGSSEQAVTCSEFAIKIFKTSILVFKDRDKYVAFYSLIAWRYYV